MNLVGEIASSSSTRREIHVMTPRLPAESKCKQLECIGSQTVNQLFYLISRYRQQKPCYVYRLVMDNTMERKIYDRQISKEVETDGVKSLVGDEEDPPPKDFDRNVIKNMSSVYRVCR